MWNTEAGRVGLVTSIFLSSASPCPLPCALPASIPLLYFYPCGSCFLHALLLVQQFLNEHISLWGKWGSCAHPTLWSVHGDKVSSAPARSEGGLHNSLQAGKYKWDLLFQRWQNSFEAPARETRYQITQRHLEARETARCSVTCLALFPVRRFSFSITLSESKKRKVLDVDELDPQLPVARQNWCDCFPWPETACVRSLSALGGHGWVPLLLFRSLNIHVAACTKGWGGVMFFSSLLPLSPCPLSSITPPKPSQCTIHMGDRRRRLLCAHYIHSTFLLTP